MDEQGQDLAEYALLICFVVVAIVGIASGFHDSIAGVVNANQSHLAAASAVVQ
jgi:Flp pilus assembly pilin Flp